MTRKSYDKLHIELYLNCSNNNAVFNSRKYMKRYFKSSRHAQIVQGTMVKLRTAYG